LRLSLVNVSKSFDYAMSHGLIGIPIQCFPEGTLVIQEQRYVRVRNHPVKERLATPTRDFALDGSLKSYRYPSARTPNESESLNSHPEVYSRKGQLVFS